MHSPHAGQEPARTPVHILSVPQTGYLLVCLAGPIRGVMMHWHGGGSYPCRPDDTCPASIHRSGSTWKGYTPCRQWDHSLGAWVPWALEVTESLELVMRGQDLRGQVWRLARAKRKRKRGQPGATVQGQLEEVRTDPALLVTFDVRLVVERRYHCPPLVWDVPNPLQPKLTVEQVSAPPPSSVPLIDPYQPAPVDPAAPRVSVADRVRALSHPQLSQAGANGVGPGH
jgi:hypothetical protein